MMVNAKATITTTAAVAFILAMNTAMLFVAAYADSSIKIAQSTGGGLEVECKGKLKCEIIGDGTVVTSSDDNNRFTVNSTTILGQSDMIQSENDLGAIDEQDLGSSITRMVNRLLDGIFAD